MGILYSHLVFQPPSPPTYADHAGLMTFRSMSPDPSDPSNPSDPSYSTHHHPPPPGNNHPPSPSSNQFITHPVFYITTSKHNVIPATYFHQQHSYYTILFSHGNGEDLGVTASYALELSKSLKTSVLCYDYSGYGIASGKPSESNCYADIRAAYEYLITEKRIPARRILLFGRSLGSGPTIHLASSLGRSLGGVVLIAALTSCVRVVFTGVPHTMKFDMFPNIDRIQNIAVPVFCVHGMMDDVVPFSHGLQLVKQARYPLEPLWIRGAGHNNLESTRFQYEVFLRYMKVLQEFKRWRVPVGPDVVMDSVPRRRDSIGAIVKAAACFGPKNDDSSVENETERQPLTRKRTQRFGSSSQLLIRPLGNRHENQLRTLWQHEKEGGRRASQEDVNKSTRRRLRGHSLSQAGIRRGSAPIS